MLRGKLPAPSRIPTHVDILIKLNKRFTRMDPHLRDLLSLCAEECERIIMEAMRPTGMPVVTFLKSHYTAGVSPTCKNCHQIQILQSYNFCPVCGVSIIWNP